MAQTATLKTIDEIRGQIALVENYYRESIQSANWSHSLLDVIRHHENATMWRGQLESLRWVLDGEK